MCVCVCVCVCVSECLREGEREREAIRRGSAFQIKLLEGDSNVHMKVLTQSLKMEMH